MDTFFIHSFKSLIFVSRINIHQWSQAKNYNYSNIMDAEEKKESQLLTDRPKLIELINKLLEDILMATADMPKGNSKFHAKAIPAMPVGEYLQSTNPCS